MQMDLNNTVKEQGITILNADLSLEHHCVYIYNASLIIELLILAFWCVVFF